MIIAAFYMGPADGRRLLLPTSEPWPRFVIPNWDHFPEIEAFYLLAGQLDEATWSYLFDDSYNGIVSSAP